MDRYRNLSGHSGVIAYEAARNSITVEFQDGAVYLYNYQSTGRSKVEQMKALASAGRGLSTFIARHVGNAYAEKLR
jgi:hypothetical protein